MSDCRVPMPTYEREELRECPFCRSTRVNGFTSYNDNRLFREYIACEDCGASTTTYATKRQAINAWNTRHERTCKMELQYALDDTSNLFAFVCSECERDIYGEITIRQCSNCGAHVEEVV